MNIVHVVARSHRRGAEMVAIELAEELDELGHTNRVVALGLAHDDGRDADLPPLVGRSGAGLPELVVAAWRLHRSLRREPVDIVLAHGGWAVQVAALALPRGGPAIVWQLILGFPEKVWRPGRRWWWELVVRRVDAAVALTRELEEEVRILGFKGPVWLIPNSRRTDRFDNLDRESETAWLRKELAIDADVALVGFVGHLVDQKRPTLAVEVLAKLHAAGCPAHLVMAGGGPLAESVARSVRSHGLTEHVSLLGHRNDVERIMAGIDLLLLTSEAEGIPGVAIEAQMAGSPVVTFPLGGVSEVVEHGVTGIVLPAHDTGAMAEAVRVLLADRLRLETMGARARALTPQFSAVRTAKRYADKMTALHVGRTATDGATSATVPSRSRRLARVLLSRR